MKKGAITVYLSLSFILLMSFVFSMIESASIQNAKNYRRADVNRAIESVFAEYQKKLLEEYDVFSLEASYETGNYSEEHVLRRLGFYGAESMQHEVKGIQLLTDHGAAAFRGQISKYMTHKYGLSAMEDMLGSTALWRQQEEEAKDYVKKERENEDELQGLLEQNEADLPEADNPIAHVGALKNASLMDIIVPANMQVSEKSMGEGQSLTSRTLHRGHGVFTDQEEGVEAVSKLLLGEYVLKHFATATDGEKTGVLDYEVEYILGGKNSDRENLGQVSQKLLLLRFVPNYAFIQTNAAMKTEAQAAALALCSVLAVPAITSAAAQGIMLAWAFGETIMDIRSLLSGYQVPAVKSKESWQLSLSGLLKLGTNEDSSAARDHGEGLDYKDYLRMLIFLKGEEETALYALSMIEQTLQKKCGLALFRADHCVSRMEIDTTCKLRRGITYRFRTYFGYN